MDMKPQISVEEDAYEHDAQSSLEKYKNGDDKDPELLNDAASKFELSNNPEGKEIAKFLRAWYLREKGKAEKNDEKACVYLIKSATAFGKDERSKKESLQIMLEFYGRKLEVCHSKHTDPTAIFGKRAKIYKELGREKEFYVEMSLHTLYLATNTKRDLNEAVQLLGEAVGYAKKSGYSDIENKLTGILHKIKSYASPTLEDAIREINEELLVIEQTSDKFGKEMALGDLSFLRSRKEAEPSKRLALLEEASNYYEQAGFLSKAHNLRGDIFQSKANSTKLDDENHSEYFKRASEEYKKAGNVRMQSWLNGHYEISLATKLGVLKENNEEFRKHLMLANHSYTDAGNVGGVQFTAGIGIFLEAVRAEYPQTLELFKLASDCLESVKENLLASLAKSEISRIRAYKTENSDERNQHMVEEKNFLERAVIESEKRKGASTVSFPVDGIKITADVLTSLSKARVEELSGFIEKDKEVSKVHFLRAKQEYLTIEGTGAYKTLVLSGIGWANIFLENVPEAKKYFDDLKSISPDNPHVKAGFEALDKLIAVKYSVESQNYIIQKRLSTPLMISLGNDVFITKSGKSYPSDFFDTWRATVIRSCKQIERYKSDFFDSEEPEIRNEILRISNSIAEVALDSTLTGESFTGKGKSDLFAKDSQDENDYFIGECKIWKTKAEYKKGFDQLVGRYLTSSDRAGLLVNFVKKGSMVDVCSKAIEAVEELDSEATINKIDDKNFISTHKEYGMIFHHLVDIVADRTFATIEKQK